MANSQFGSESKVCSVVVDLVKIARAYASKWLNLLGLKNSLDRVIRDVAWSPLQLATYPIRAAS